MKLGVDPDTDRVWLLGVNPFAPSNRTLRRSEEAEHRNDWKAIVKYSGRRFIYTMKGPLGGKYRIYAPTSNLAVYAAMRETARWTKKRERVARRRALDRA